jgi:hypothetical protein
VRPERRARRRTNLADLERLEERALLAFSNLGFSLPDLTISGIAGPVAAWGGTLNVTATIKNQGATTTTNPIAQAPGDPSTADAPASTVTVLITPRRSSLAGAVSLGSFVAPAVPQNSLEMVTESFTLPARPAGFRGAGGKFFIRLVVNSNHQVLEANTTNDLSRPIAVSVVSQALPELRATALYVPPVMQPGDTIAPVIQVENIGTAASGPVEVALVASTTKSFTAGSSIVALYTLNETPALSSIPSASETPTGGNILSYAQNLTPPGNVVTITGAPVTLPTSPATYFLGVVVDPFGLIKQLSVPKNNFTLIHDVGPPIPNLPPAGVVSAANNFPFPEPASGNLIGIVSTTPPGTIQ